MSGTGVERSSSRVRLSQYYGLEGEHSTEQQEGQPGRQPAKRKPSLKSAVRNAGGGSPNTPNPLDINGPEFDPDLYVSKLVSEASLAQLMAQEGEIVRQIQGLDSDMQTLVYENYNKFIAATETIRKMRVDFRSMEEEMEQLAGSMSSITSFSSQVSDQLRTRRQDVARLSAAHSTLKGLQFILELPERLKQSISEGKPAQAVDYWLRTEVSLSQYRDMPSFAGIQEDCEQIMAELKSRLQQQMKDPQCEGDELRNAVELLRQLGSGSEELSSSYLDHCSVGLEAHLVQLEDQVEVLTGEKERNSSLVIMDPLEFVDEACNKFLAELCLACTGFRSTFTSPVTGETEEQERFEDWVERLVTRFLVAVGRRLSQEQDQQECPLLVRALDRLHRRLAANARLVPCSDLAGSGLSLVLEVAEVFCKGSSLYLEVKVEELMMDVRQTIAQPRRGGEGVLDLQEVSTGLLTSIADNVRSTIDSLQTFLDPDLSFSPLPKFRARFCSDLVTEGVLMRHFRHILTSYRQFCGSRSVPPALLLLLSRTCHDLHTSTTSHLASLLADQLGVQQDMRSQNSLASINSSLASLSHHLLDSYVQAQAADLSLMLRKSVEARDWLSTVEPRSVRAVMKRVVEDVTLIDEQVGQLYEEGQRKVRSSDSSRTYGTGHRSRSVFSSFATSSSNLDSSLASNIQRLFSEKIDYFAPVTASKVSVLTGIIKLGLKTLLECVRLKTFGRYGLQQMQVDCHYLQLYLWRFVSDEAVVHQLLDEVLASALHRGLEHPPILMEASVVEVICDKGG